MACEHPGKMVTEREAVEREREAFKRGAGWYAATPATFNVFALDSVARNRAATLYPLPKVRRLREVEVEGRAFRFEPSVGTWRTRRGDGEWLIWTGCAAPSLVGHLADLKANPWEEVDA